MICYHRFVVPERLHCPCSLAHSQHVAWLSQPNLAVPMLLQCVFGFTSFSWNLVPVEAECFEYNYIITNKMLKIPQCACCFLGGESQTHADFKAPPLPTLLPRPSAAVTSQFWEDQQQWKRNHLRSQNLLKPLRTDAMQESWYLGHKVGEQRETERGIDWISDQWW